MQEKSVFTVKKGRGDGSGETAPRQIRIPDAIWFRAEELGIDRAEVVRQALIDAIEQATAEQDAADRR